jgi:DNA-binding SARP family transcriptional activator
LWPESARAAQSRAALRYTLSCLRAALRHDDGSSHLIEGKAPGFDLDTAEELDYDVRDFQALAGPHQPGETRQALAARLQQAATLSRGEFLEGFSVRDAPEFEAWLTHQAEGWQRRVLSVLDRLSQAQADAGRVAEARETTDRWVALSPLDERAYQRGIQLAMAAGDRAGAQRAYEACRGILQRELGVGPAPETEALVHRAEMELLAHRPKEVGAPAGEHAPTLLHMPLVGRAAEFGHLVEAYHVAGAGERGPRCHKERLALERHAWPRSFLPGRRRRAPTSSTGVRSKPVAASPTSRWWTGSACAWSERTPRTTC